MKPLRLTDHAVERARERMGMEAGEFRRMLTRQMRKRPDEIRLQCIRRWGRLEVVFDELTGEIITAYFVSRRKAGT